MRQRRPLLPLLALALALVGCAPGIEGRIAQRQEIFDGYPADVQTRLRRGQIRVGDDADAVWMVYGKPNETIRRTDANGVSEVWVYKILGYHDSLYPSVRPVYHDVRGTVRGSYYIDDTPEYEWKEVLRVEFSGGRVTAIQMRE